MEQKGVEYCLGAIVAKIVDKYDSNEQEKKFIRLEVFNEVKKLILNHNFMGKIIINYIVK